MFDKSPTLFPIKDRYAFLSHCGIAPLYSGGLGKMTEVAQAQCLTGALVFGRYDPILDGLRDAAAQLLKTTPDNLAFVKNTTEGIGLIAAGYPFEPGDQVISYVHEYPANHYPWKLQERRGVELVLLPDCDSEGRRHTPCDESLTRSVRPTFRPVAWSMGDLEQRVTPRTRIVALSHVQFASGFAADLKSLADFCSAREIDLVVDAAQSLGVLPIEPDEWNIAAVVSSGWKWLMGPIGCGLLYTSKNFRAKLQPVLVGAETMRQGTDYLDHTWNPFDSAKRFEYSTSPIALAAALEACIREAPLRYGVEAIRGEIFRLQDVFLNAVDRTRFRPVFAPEEGRSPILSLIVSGDANALRRLLLKESVITTERGGYLRIAPHFYNTDEEMLRAAGLFA
ncbi:MAG: aminotransferase class V-fold PLP-dependent enzyme [Planctomycetes bacterium]|nr:aminotransferase class V-fold PLP-dependent enzyme [Planctomycetota bacterium]